MNKTSFIFLSSFVFCLYFIACKGQTQPQNNSLKLIASIPLPDVNGRIDHLAFDPAQQLIFIAALGNNTVEVVDIKNKKLIHTINNLSEPQGIIFIPQNNSLFVSNGNNGECDIFDAKSFQKINSLKLSGDADNVRFDSVDNKIYVGYGKGGIAIIDADSFKLIKEIKLSAHPESFQIDKTANKIYVNVPDEKKIEIIELEKKLVTTIWKIKEATSNFPMYLDEENHHLFIGCRHPAKLLVIDTQTGKTITSFEIDKDIDDIFMDKTTKKLFLSCGEGYIDVFKQTDSNNFISDGKISTYSGARTSLFIPTLNMLIIASPASKNRTASLLIYAII